MRLGSDRPGAQASELLRATGRQTPFEPIVAFVAAALGLSLTGVAPVQAEDKPPETPAHAYEIRVECAGAAAAAVAEADMANAGSEKERADARRLVTETRDEAISAGDRIGRSATEVSDAIDGAREGILKRFSRVAGDPDGLAKEKADLGRVVIDCALVEAIERRDAMGVPPAAGNKAP